MIQVNVLEIKKDVKLHNERAHHTPENINTELTPTYSSKKYWSERNKNMATFKQQCPCQPQVSLIIICCPPCLFSFSYLSTNNQWRFYINLHLELAKKIKLTKSKNRLENQVNICLKYTNHHIWHYPLMKVH